MKEKIVSEIVELSSEIKCVSKSTKFGEIILAIKSPAIRDDDDALFCPAKKIHQLRLKISLLRHRITTSLARGTQIYYNFY